jgi:acetyl-CoA acetyltransferase
MNTVYIAGTGSTRFGRHSDTTIEALAVDAAARAIVESGIDRSRIGAVYLGNFVSGPLNGKEVLAGLVAEQLGLQGIPCTKVEGACASGGIAMRHACLMVASGMCDAGRIVHHLQNNLPRAQNAIVITGFQAYGSLGRRLVDKAAKVRLFGEEVVVRASIHTIGGLSAHADQAGLLDWLQGFKSAPQSVFVVHGEPEASTVLAQSIREELDWKNVIIPERLHTYTC